MFSEQRGRVLQALRLISQETQEAKSLVKQNQFDDAILFLNNVQNNVSSVIKRLQKLNEGDRDET
jgi:predicted translin family RNA/ssDNA-binding protein